MAIARFKDLCIDCGGGDRLGRFWAAALGLQFEPDDESGTIVGDTPEQRIWMNTVPEPKTVKHRVHIDVHCESVEALVALGARVLERSTDTGRDWTVMVDPEGGEFCAFVRGQVPDYRLYELSIDSASPETIASWWADVFGAELGGEKDKGWWSLEGIRNLPFADFTFAAVPEPKTLKNRIHWDVTVRRVQDLVDAGATVLREPTAADEWYVLADPEGNEFCAFIRT